MMIDGYVADILNNQIINEINAKKAIDKEKLIEKDIKSVENRIRHAFNQGYEAGLKHGKEIDMESKEIKILQKRAYLEGFHEASKMLVKQEPLNDVLDEIRAEIDRQYKWLINTRYTIHDVDIAFGSIFRTIDEYRKGNKE